MLKRLIAITVLLVHLFSIGGQLAVYQYMVYKSDRFFNEQISKNRYRIDDLSEICIPAAAPGVTDWKYFQPIHGSVRFKNTGYNYVGIKITRDAIYLMCIPNYETTHLSNQNIIYARQIPDIPVPHKDHVPFGKLNLSVCSYLILDYTFSAPAIIVRRALHNNPPFIPDSFIPGPGRPPNAA